MQLLNFLLRRAQCSATALTILSIGAALPASAATYYVATTGTDAITCGKTAGAPCKHIQFTINQRAAAGDVIQIAEGTYTELVTVNKSLTLTGPAGVGATVDGDSQGTVVSIPSGVKAILDWLIIQHGSVAATAPGDIAGGIYNAGNLGLNDSLVWENQASSFEANQTPVAGGVLNEGTFTSSLAVIENNSATGGCFTAGGIITTAGSTIVMNLGTVQGNTVTSTGGCVGPAALPIADGLFNDFGTATLNMTSVTGNGVVNNGTLTVNQSTVSEAGTGVNNFDKLTVVNSTFTGNGTGISNAIGEHTGTMDMSNGTVAQNLGVGVVFGPPLSSIVRNSILSGNPGGDCSGEFLSGDYNLIQKTASCTFVGGGHEITGTTAMQGKLSRNGGFTETLLPAKGSPVINAGNPAGCENSAGQPITVDQRGLPRPNASGARCDIGAIEVQ